MLFLAGCSTVPFEPAPEANFQGLEPAVVVSDFDQAVGQEFELLESVVFKFFGKEITGLGALKIDPANSSYALTCMTPTGITVFEVRGEGTTAEAPFVPPQMEKHRDHFAEAVGRDLRRIYLDWTPSADAKVKHKKNRLVFVEKRSAETIKYTFSGEKRLLTEKRFSKGWKTRCTIRYFDYKKRGEKLYPMGIVLHNKQFHYRMILRVKEVYPKQNQTKGKHLLVYCKKFDKACTGYHPNIQIKKIPSMLMGRCEFGQEDYSLNIVNLTDEETAPEFVPSGPPAGTTNSSPRKRGNKNPKQQELF